MKLGFKIKIRFLCNIKILAIFSQLFVNIIDFSAIRFDL